MTDTESFAHVDQMGGTCTLLNKRSAVAILWAYDQSLLPEYERSFPFRRLLHEWLTNHPTQTLVHAGAVGNAESGVLLAGAGGSGKSTSTLACLEGGLRYAGDDFVLVDVNRSYVHSLYNVAKLNADNLVRFPALAPLIANTHSLPAEKAQLYLYQHRPQALAAGLRLQAIILPRFGNVKVTTLLPATAADALKALAPSTLGLLRADQRTFTKLTTLARSLPAYHLITGTDLAQIPARIQTLLHTIAAHEPTSNFGNHTCLQC